MRNCVIDWKVSWEGKEIRIQRKKNNKVTKVFLSGSQTKPSDGESLQTLDELRGFEQGFVF